MNALPEAIDDHNQIRRHIDIIDRKIHKLLIKRLGFVEQISLSKASFSECRLPSYAPERETKILKRHDYLAKSQHEKDFLHDTYRSIFAASRSLQQKFNIGIYSKNSHLTLAAAIYHFGDYHSYKTNDDLALMLEKLKIKNYDYIVVEKKALTLPIDSEKNLGLLVCAEFTLKSINMSFLVLGTNF